MNAISKTPRRAITRTPSRDVRAALLDAAEAVLVRDGAEALTVRAVAAEAGVAPMGVYNRFGSKDGLVEAILIRAFGGLQAAVTGRPDELDPVERLRSSGKRYRLFALANPQQYAAMFGGALSSDEPSTELLVCAGDAFGALEALVGTAMAAGRLRAADVREVAQQLWSAVHGAVTLEMQGKVLTKDPEATYHSLLDLVIRGLLTAPDTAGGSGGSASVLVVTDPLRGR